MKDNNCDGRKGAPVTGQKPRGKLVGGGASRTRNLDLEALPARERWGFGCEWTDTSATRPRAGRYAAFAEVAKESQEERTEVEELNPRTKTGFQRTETAGEEEEDKRERESERAGDGVETWRESWNGTAWA